MRVVWDHSDKVPPKDTGELVKYYTARFDNERQLSFFRAFMFLNILAEDQKCMFEYRVDEPENTESFRLVAKKISIVKDGFSDKALLGALAHFDELQIKTEGEQTVISGTKSPEKVQKKTP